MATAGTIITAPAERSLLESAKRFDARVRHCNWASRLADTLQLPTYYRLIEICKSRRGLQAADAGKWRN